MVRGKEKSEQLGDHVQHRVHQSPGGNPSQNSGALATRWRAGSGGMSVRLSFPECMCKVGDEEEGNLSAARAHTHTPAPGSESRLSKPVPKARLLQKQAGGFAWHYFN